MIVNLDNYRKKREVSQGFIRIPVFEKLYMKDGQLIGEFHNGDKLILEDHKKNK